MIYSLQDIKNGTVFAPGARFVALAEADADLASLCQRLMAELRAYREQLDAANEEVRLHRDKSNGDYWVWQGDGGDYLESLTCPVLIPAAELAALQRFKGWTHNYLDTHGVPHHPPGAHGAQGCRIGDRMDWLMAQRDELAACLADMIGAAPENSVALVRAHAKARAALAKLGA